MLVGFGYIGTSSIAHKQNSVFKWFDGEAFKTISRAVMNGLKFKKLEETPQYLVTHYNELGGGDF